MKANEYMHLYIGCDTNLGKLVGVNERKYFIQLANGEIMERGLDEKQPAKLLLRKISDLNLAESTELSSKGFSIGRPRGYSFSPEAILYLISLRIDIFNLIANDLSIEIQNNYK